jgi:hypothetical protein
LDPQQTSGNGWIKEERRRRIVGFVGGYLIEDGAMTLEDLDRGLEMQLRLSAQGRQLRLGEVLIEMGIITREQLERALAHQAREESQALKRAVEEQK